VSTVTTTRTKTPSKEILPVCPAFSLQMGVEEKKQLGLKTLPIFKTLNHDFHNMISLLGCEREILVLTRNYESRPTYNL
jgi:hypothetical protein